MSQGHRYSLVAVCGVLGLAVAAWMAQLTLEWTGPIEPATLTTDAGFAYAHTVSPPWPLQLASGGNAVLDVPALRLFEDGRMLAPGRVTPAQVRAIGGGRFVQTGRRLLFSASDGGDPRINGRHYSLIAGVRIDPRLAVSLAGASLALIVLAIVRQNWAVPKLPGPFVQVAGDARRLAPHLWVYALVVVVAYGLEMFNVLLSGDDWEALQVDGYQYQWVVAIGRWMQVVVWWLAEDNAFAPALTLGVLAAAYLCVALVLAQCLGLKRDFSKVALAALLVTFPLNAESFSFSLLHLPLALGLVCAGGATLLLVAGQQAITQGERRQAWAYGGVTVPLVMLAAACYQPAAIFVVSGILLRALALLRSSTSLSEMRRSVGGLLAYAAMAITAGVIAYGLSVHIVAAMAGVSLNQDGLYAMTGSLNGSLADWGKGVGGGVAVVADLLLSPHHLFPPVAKVVLVAALALAAGLYGGRGALWRLPAFIVLLAALLLAPASLGMVRNVGNYRFNSLIAFAVPMAGLVALVVDEAAAPTRRRLMASMAVLLVAVFAFQQNRASVSTLLLNRRDMAIAGRMLARIDAVPGFASLAEQGQVDVVVVGRVLEQRHDLGRPFSPKSHGRVTHLDNSVVDCGVFNCQIQRLESAVRLISEHRVNYRFRVWPEVPSALSPAGREDLARRIAQAHPWPAPDAVIEADGVVVLILQPAPGG